MVRIELDYLQNIDISLMLSESLDYSYKEVVDDKSHIKDIISWNRTESIEAYFNSVFHDIEKFNRRVASILDIKQTINLSISEKKLNEYLELSIKLKEEVDALKKEVIK